LGAAAATDAAEGTLAPSGCFFRLGLGALGVFSSDLGVDLRMDLDGRSTVCNGDAFCSRFTATTCVRPELGLAKGLFAAAGVVALPPAWAWATAVRRQGGAGMKARRLKHLFLNKIGSHHGNRAFCYIAHYIQK